MAWDTIAKKTAIKVIGTVETGMRYDGINYRDPITVGMMQWYGTRAADILNLMRVTPAWVGVATSLTSDLVNKPQSNGSFWTSRYLTRTEGDSLKPVLRSVTGKRIQHEKTLDDLEDYKYQGERVGLNADTQTKQFIYFAVMYHQSPLYARQVMNTARANPSLDRIHSIALNHKWYSQFKSRQNTAYTMINNMDHSGIPDFGVDPDPTPDPDPDVEDDEEDWDHGGSSDPTRATGDIISISLVGDSLHVRTKGDATVICNPTNTGMLWRPGSMSQPGAGPDIVPPTPAYPDPDEPPPPPPPDPTNPPTSGSKFVPVTPNPNKVSTYKGRKFTNIMLDCVRSWEHACVAEGIPFIMVQGGWNPGGVAASAGSHDKDGGDLRSRTMNLAQATRCIELGRERGMCVWFRTNGAKWGVRAQGFKGGEHIHFVPNKWGTPSGVADRQAAQYRKGTDGLVGARPDVGPGHVSTYRTRTWPDFVALYK